VNVRGRLDRPVTRGRPWGFSWLTENVVLAEKTKAGYAAAEPRGASRRRERTSTTGVKERIHALRESG